VTPAGSFSESIVEEAALSWLRGLGWAVAHGPDIAVGEPGAERSDPDYRDVVLERRLRQALARLNPNLPPEALEDAYRKLTRVDAPSLVHRNRAVHRMLVDGVTVEYRRPDGSIAGAQARVVDFDLPAANDWLAVNQFTVSEGQHTRRPDVVLFLNGLPLAVLELKNAAEENATVWSAFHQLQTYQAQVPALFATNAVLVASDGVQARIGTLGAGKEWFKPWRTITGLEDAPAHEPELHVLLEGVFEHRRFLDLLRYFIVFEDSSAVGGLHRGLAEEVPAAGERAEELVVQVVAVGEHHQGGILHRGVQDDTPGVEGHRQALARTLGMPDNTDAPVARFATVPLARFVIAPLADAHLPRTFCCTQRFADRHIDCMELVVAPHLLGDLRTIIFKDDEIT
jgi:hypothetical protein